MPPVACSGTGSEGSQMLLAAPRIPLVPELHSPIRPPMSPMPGTWHTPLGAAGFAGVRLAVSRAGVAVASFASAVLAVVAALAALAAWVAWAAWVAASAGVAIARAATARSSTWMTRREMRRPGRRDSARSRRGEPAGSGEADELALVRELLGFCG